MIPSRCLIHGSTNHTTKLERFLPGDIYPWRFERQTSASIFKCCIGPQYTWMPGVVECKVRSVFTHPGATHTAYKLCIGINICIWVYISICAKTHIHVRPMTLDADCLHLGACSYACVYTKYQHIPTATKFYGRLHAALLGFQVRIEPNSLYLITSYLYRKELRCSSRHIFGNVRKFTVYCELERTVLLKKKKKM